MPPVLAVDPVAAKAFEVVKLESQLGESNQKIAEAQSAQEKLLEQVRQGKQVDPAALGTAVTAVTIAIVAQQSLEKALDAKEAELTALCDSAKQAAVSSLAEESAALEEQENVLLEAFANGIAAAVVAFRKLTPPHKVIPDKVRLTDLMRAVPDMLGSLTGRYGAGRLEGSFGAQQTPSGGIICLKVSDDGSPSLGDLIRDLNTKRSAAESLNPQAMAAAALTAARTESA